MPFFVYESDDMGIEMGNSLDVDDGDGRLMAGDA